MLSGHLSKDELCINRKQKIVPRETVLSLGTIFLVGTHDHSNISLSQSAVDFHILTF